MPVTFNLANHHATEVRHGVSSGEDLLRESASSVYEQECARVFSSSLGNDPAINPDIVPCQNGLIDAVVAAYNKHHALVLRPDDIWLSIVIQFSFFVNKHAEQLRGRFVAHEGSLELHIDVQRHSDLFDAAVLAPMFTNEMAKHVTDAKLRGWIVPEFSTTTPSDRIVGCAALMGAMKKYFGYIAHFRCGIPQITLEGTREDWEAVLRRADRIAEYGDECVLWHRKLVPVLRRFVATFDDPRLEKSETKTFWESMVQYKNPGSGTPYISGWLTAFCAFNAEGKWLHTRPAQSPMLDGVEYSIITTDNIPAGYVTVDIKLDDRGTEYRSMLLAGLVGQRVTSSGNLNLPDSGSRDTVSPATSWWLVEKFSEEEKARRAARAMGPMGMGTWLR